MAISDRKIRSLLIFGIALLTLKCNTTNVINSKIIDCYINRVVYTNSSSQFRSLPQITIDASIVNKSSDTLLFITSKNDFVSYSNDFFKIDSLSDTNEKRKLRSEIFLPIESDSTYHLLNPNDPINREIIILPQETKAFKLYRNCYDVKLTTDYNKLLNNLRGIKINYYNSLNYDSLSRRFPNYHIVKKLVITRRDNKSK